MQGSLPESLRRFEALIRGDCDAAMIVASDPVAHLLGDFNDFNF